MMILAPIGYAVIEFCRVPLALSIRTQRSFVVRCLAALGVICAAGVTVKSMSMLGEIMFRPRLFDVVHAQGVLDAARNALATIDQRIAEADAVAQQRTSELKDADARAISDARELGNLPKQQCLPTAGFDRKGNAYRSFRCTTDPRVAALMQAMKISSSVQASASAKLDAARKALEGLDRSEAAKALSQARVAYREAVLHSQLHSFTAMVFGKSPTEVTDAEVYLFLRIFVFAPAVFVSIASTLLALTAVERVDPSTICVPDETGQYILAPYTSVVTEEAIRAAEHAARDAIRRAAHGVRRGDDHVDHPQHT